MGERTFIKTIVATSAEEGFRTLYNDAEVEHGHEEGYSGDINSTNLSTRAVKTYVKPTKKNENEALKLADETLKFMSKGMCRYINLGLAGIVLVTASFEKAAKSSNPYYKEVYTFYAMTSGGRTKLSDTKDTSIEAKKFAIEYSLKHGECIWMKKEKVMDKGNGEVGTVNLTRKEIKAEPKALKPNQKVIKYYKYMLFGCTAE